MKNYYNNAAVQYCLIGLFLVVVSLISGCAKLPMENDAPGAPILFSDGEYHPGGVEIRVNVDDPDGDMVSLHFQATNSNNITQDFIWTSFIASSEEAYFFLNLSVGQWTLAAQAKDELEELSPTASYDMTVAVP